MRADGQRQDEVNHRDDEIHLEVAVIRARGALRLEDKSETEMTFSTLESLMLTINSLPTDGRWLRMA